MGLGSCQTYLLGRPHKGGYYGPPALFTGCVTIKPSKLFNALLDWVLFTENTHTPLEDPTKVDAMGHQFAQRMIGLRLLKHPSSIVCQ